MLTTECKSSRRLNKFRRTSEFSSLTKAKKIGKIWSFVTERPTIGQSANKFSASAHFT